MDEFCTFKCIARGGNPTTCIAACNPQLTKYTGIPFQTWLNSPIAMRGYYSNPMLTQNLQYNPWSWIEARGRANDCFIQHGRY
jgi:hypothetical protein